MSASSHPMAVQTNAPGVVANVNAHYVIPYTGTLPVETTESNEFVLPPTHVRVTVIQGFDIKNPDDVNYKDPPDSFVLLAFNDRRGQPYKDVLFTTRTVENNSNPEWGEEFVLELKEGDAACSGLVEVWDKHRESGHDFLGSIRVEFDLARAQKEFKLGPRIDWAPSLTKMLQTISKNEGAIGSAWGSVVVKWQYERMSSPSQDCQWYCKRALIARSVRKYDLARQLLAQAKRCDALDPIVEELENETARMKEIERKGIKDDSTHSAIADDELRVKWRQYYDTERNGYITKEDFKRIYKQCEATILTDPELDTILGPFRMLHPLRLSFDEFAIAMLKCAQC